MTKCRALLFAGVLISSPAYGDDWNWDVGPPTHFTAPATPWWDQDHKAQPKAAPWERKSFFFPGGFNVLMSPADERAIAKLTLKQLPPVEFDRRVKDPVEINYVDTEEELRRLCGLIDYFLGFTVIGCAG